MGKYLDLIEEFKRKEAEKQRGRPAMKSWRVIQSTHCPDCQGKEMLIYEVEDVAHCAICEGALDTERGDPASRGVSLDCGYRFFLIICQRCAEKGDRDRQKNKGPCPPPEHLREAVMLLHGPCEGVHEDVH